MVLRVRPFEITVFDFEAAIWGYEEGLDWREVGADYVGGRVGVGHFASGVSMKILEKREEREYIAHIPVPVPMSRILCGLSRGARWSFPSRVRRYM